MPCESLDIVSREILFNEPGVADGTKNGIRYDPGVYSCVRSWPYGSACTRSNVCRHRQRFDHRRVDHRAQSDAWAYARRDGHFLFDRVRACHRCPPIYASDHRHRRDRTHRVRGAHPEREQGRIDTANPGQDRHKPVPRGTRHERCKPGLWLWWLSIGSAMVIAGLAGGIFLAALFMAGHWSADLAWFTLVSFGISRGTVSSDRTYRIIMASAGSFWSSSARITCRPLLCRNKLRKGAVY